MEKKARKQLEKIGDSEARKEISRAGSTLVDFPHVKNVKALVSHRCGYRLRVGDYRVLFEVATVLRIVSIEEVRKRDDRTY